MLRISLILSIIISYSNITAQTFLIPYVDTNKQWGFCDTNGKVIIKPRWAGVNFFEKNKAIVRISESLYATIDTSGNYILPPSLHWTGIANGLANSYFNVHDAYNNWGLVDNKGNFIIPCQYDPQDMYPFVSSDNIYHRPVLAVKKKGKAGIIDTAGHILIPFDYNYISMYDLAYIDKGFIKIRKGGKENIIDYANQLLLPDYYDELVRNVKDSNGVIVISNKKFGYLSYPSMHLGIPAEYDMLNKVDSYIIAVKGGKYGLFDLKFSERLPFNYSGISIYDDQLRVEKTTHFKAKNGKDSSSMSFRYLDIHTQNPLGEWVVDNPSYHFPIQSMSCYQPEIQRFNNNENDAGPQILINGALTRNFVKDSIRWETQSSTALPKGELLVYGTLRSNQTIIYSAIFDEQLNYIVPPVPRPCIIKNYNPRDSLITVYKNGNYGMFDQRLYEVFPFQPKQINYGFKWKGKVYVSVYDHNSPENGDLIILKGSGQILHFMGTDLKYVAGLNPYRIDGVADEYGRTDYENKYRYPCIWAYNKSGKRGLITVTGEVLFPEISFRYNQLYGFGDGLFIGIDTKDSIHYMSRLYNARNEELFPKLDVATLEPAYIETINQYGFDSRRDNPIPHIYKLIYNTDYQRQDFFYINKNGKAYNQRFE